MYLRVDCIVYLSTLYTTNHYQELALSQELRNSSESSHEDLKFCNLVMAVVIQLVHFEPAFRVHYTNLLCSMYLIQMYLDLLSMYHICQ